MGMFHVGSQTPECMISKGFVACFSASLIDLAYPLCMPHKPVYRWDKMFYLGSCPSSCFGVHKCSSHSNLWVGGAKAPPDCLPHVNAWSWPHQLRIPPWRSLGTNSFYIKLLQPCRRSHLPQSIRLNEITLLTCSIKVCLPFQHVHFVSRFNSDNNRPHSDGYGHTIISQAHVAWRNHLLSVNCCPTQSHVLCDSWVHDPFANAHRMRFVLCCKCKFVLIFCIFYNINFPYDKINFYVSHLDLLMCPCNVTLLTLTYHKMLKVSTSKCNWYNLLKAKPCNKYFHTVVDEK